MVDFHPPLEGGSIKFAAQRRIFRGGGVGAVGEVRQGKVIDLELKESDEAKARASLKDMCEKLLANTVIEKYEIELKA